MKTLILILVGALIMPNMGNASNGLPALDPAVTAKLNSITIAPLSQREREFYIMLYQSPNEDMMIKNIMNFMKKSDATDVESLKNQLIVSYKESSDPKMRSRLQKAIISINASTITIKCLLTASFYNFKFNYWRL